MINPGFGDDEDRLARADPPRADGNRANGWMVRFERRAVQVIVEMRDHACRGQLKAKLK
jgi:hypothetical protein